jgi:hypothetical protein
LFKISNHLLFIKESHAVDWAATGRILKSGAQTLHNTAKSVCNGVICAVSSNSQQQQQAQPNQVEKKENESTDGGHKRQKFFFLYYYKLKIK